MTNPRAQLNIKINTKVSHNNNGGTTQTAGSITTPDLQVHLGRLKEVSTVASKIYALLGEQIALVSSTIPIKRGHETVVDLRARVDAHREGLKTAFDPLREHIDRVKTGFWAKNCESLEISVRSCVEKRIKERVLAEVGKQLEKYLTYLRNKEVNNRKLEQALEMSHARTRNSLLRSKYPAEPVAWIGNLPDGMGLVISFAELIRAERHSAIKLTESLGLSTTDEDNQVDALNKTMRYLGIGYQALPSRTGVLLVPTIINA